MKQLTKSRILSILLVLAMVFSMLPPSVFAADSVTLADHVVINQAYGGGGNNGAEYKNDFIELYNPTDTDVDLSGWSIQYASYNGKFNQKLALSGTIKAKGFYLIQMAAGNNGTRYLPTPDATGSFTMAANEFKLALSKSTDAVSGKSDENVVDFLGAGSSANEYEGSAAAPAASNTTSVIRKTDGLDTNDNSADFETAAPNPRNSSYGTTTLTAAAPTASPEAGKVESGTKIAFSCATEGATIYYKTTGDYQVYSTPVAITEDTTFTVYAVKGEDKSEEKTFAYTIKAEEPTVVPISTVLAGENNTSFTVKGVVTLVEVSGSSTNLYLQDATGGLCLRVSGNVSDDVSLGDTLIGTGSKTVYNGLPQLGSGSYEKSEGLTLTPKVTTIADLTVADVATYVKLTKLTVTEVYDNNGAYSTPNITVTDGTNSIQIYKAVTTKTDGAWDIAVGDEIDVLAAVGVNNTTLQLRNTLSTEITPSTNDPISDDMIGEGVLNIKQANEADATNVTVIGQVVYHYGSAYNGAASLNSVILEDIIDGQIYGFQIYDYTNYSQYVVGDIVKVTGNITTYNGVKQMSTPTMEVVQTGTEPIPAQEITVSQLGADYLSEYVYIKDVTLGTYNGSGSTTVTDSTGSINLYKGAPLPSGAAEADVTGVYACCSAYNTTYQLRNGVSGDYVTNLSANTSLPAHGDKVVIYNLSAKGVLAAENDSESIENALAEIVDGKAVPANGSVVFTVEENGTYYRFYNETYGYLCSNGTGNNAFYSTKASEDADWTLSTGKSGGFNLESRTAKYNGTYSQYLEYYADSYKTYSMYNVTDYDIYEFFFYQVDENSIMGSIEGGIVNLPEMVFDISDPIKGQDWVVKFSVNTVFGLEGDIIVTVYSDKTGDGEDTKEIADAAVLTGPDVEGNYTITVSSEILDACGAGIQLNVTATDTKDHQFGYSTARTIIDKPSVGEVTPAPNSQTKDNKRPVISAEIANAGENPAITMTVAGEAVTAEYADGIVSYTPAADLADGRTSVTITVKREDGKEVSRTWAFIVGEAQYQLYFGQLHSHTTYSDGSGTLESALDYIASLPESANVDFVAFTDHSNYFDTSSAANPEGALYDMSLASAYSQNLWSAYKNAIADFNASQNDVIAIGGFEMTWSGGPGHINTFSTSGIVSRNNTTLNNKTSDAGMKAYYSLLSQSEGVDSISQFNHPGSTFGTFSDFAYWDALIDSRIQLVEVGNGEGQIGAGGYYPSYEYYTMALDKGWHVAPTNNQDNHKGKWGNANDARDVILTDDFSEEGIYQAIRDLRVYATEDKNLEIGYTVNGLMLGSSITEVPESLCFEITVYDPDSSDSISKVELIVNSGKVAYTWSDPADLADGALEATLDPTYSYYYVRVTEGDGDLAVTAPVWVGESLKLGISSVETATSTPVTGEELTITTTLFNSESTDATIKSLTYTTNGSVVLGSDTAGYTIPASGSATVEFAYTPTDAKLTVITVTAVVELEDTEYTFTMDIDLDVQDADKLVYIGIDASHYNEYVNGNYKDSMGNFSELAAGYGVRTVVLYESEDLIAACSNEKYKALILTAPSRRSSEAQASDPLKVYTAEELAAIDAFNQEGGTVILAGWSDHYENYPKVASIANMTAQEHMAATQNAILEKLGSSLRIGDDATYDDAYNGGEAYRLYFNTYGDNFLTDGIEVDPENPHDRLYTEVFSHYGGASVYTTDGILPSTVTPLVFGHSGTYSVDVDGDGLGGDSMYKYEYAEGDNRLMIMAAEQLENRGLIIVSGAAFMSNFEVQATIEDSGSEKNYSNYKICENLLNYINPATVTPIAEVMEQTEAGYKYTIEGTVTSNASGYDKDTAFFDCIYVQDETGGICCFPVAGSYKIGDQVRITGTTDFYQGEPELQVTSIEVIGGGEPVAPAEVTASEINDRSAEGKLVTLSGSVKSYELANGLVQTIMVEDKNGDTARVFIDGYITTGEDVKNLAAGCSITVTGLASYDDTFNAPEGPFPRIRIRDRADVVCTAHIHDFTNVVTAPTCVADGYTEYLCKNCDYSFRDTFVPSSGHTTSSQVTAPTHDRMGYTVTSCANCDYSFIHSFVAAEEHDFVSEVTRKATCTTEGEMTFTCDCGETYTMVIPVTGHSCSASVVAPTCEKYGYTIYQCASCEYSYLSDPTEPTGHSYTGKYVGGGLMQYTCQCGHTYTDLHDCPSSEYTDLDPDRWYHEAMDFILSGKIMVGTAEGIFTPNGELTRGQLITILYRLAGEPETAGATPFTDVAETAYYADAVAWGYANGIILGVSDSKFAPSQSVTREQMATFLYRYAGSPEIGRDAVKAFDDSSDISTYALDAMNWIVGAGIVNGTTSSTLSPQDSATRAQAAVVVYRYLNAE